MATTSLPHVSDKFKSSGEFSRSNPVAVRESSTHKLGTEHSIVRSDSFRPAVDRRDFARATNPIRSGKWKWMASAAVASAALAAFQPWKLQSSEIITNEQHVATLRTVEVASPSTAASSSVVLPATLRPWQSTELVARVSGYLKKWHRDLGDHVTAGDVLAEIDTPELDQELAAADAFAREADAAAIQARAERVEAEADLKVAEAQLERSKAELELAKSQFARRTKLFASKIVTQEEFDTFQRQLETRVAEQDATASEVSRRRSNLETRTAIIAVRDATAKSRQSTVHRLQELQTFKKIVAPFDGTIIRRNAEVGMLISAGKEILFAVEDMSRIRVLLNVPQAYSVQTDRRS